MTAQRSFKRVVRARMAKTGERYAAARAALLANDDRVAAADAPFTMADEAIQRRTGRGWEAWFDLLDESPVAGQSHTAIARWVHETQDVDGWTSQAITVSYERGRGGRAVGQRPEGFEITVSKTVGVPVERLFEVVVDQRSWPAWLADGQLRERTTLPMKSARYDWGDGATRVNCFFGAKGEDRSTINVVHERLPDAAEAARMKTFWRARLADLQRHLEA
jgi:hypothetical protein